MDKDRRKILVFGDRQVEENIMRSLDCLRYDVRTPFGEWDSTEHRTSRSSTLPNKPDFIAGLLVPAGRDSRDYFAVIVDRGSKEYLAMVREIGYKGPVVAITTDPYDEAQMARMQPPFDEEKEWECGCPEGADAAVSVSPVMEFHKRLEWNLEKLARKG